MRFGAHFQHAFGQPILTADEPKSDQFRVLKQRVETRWGYTRNRYSPTSFMFTHITPSPERLWWKIELQCFWARHPFACDVRLKLEAFTIDALPFSLVTWFPLKAQIFKLTVRINVKASMRALQAVWRWSMGFRFAFNTWVPAKKKRAILFHSFLAKRYSFPFLLPEISTSLIFLQNYFWRHKEFPFLQQHALSEYYTVSHRNIQRCASTLGDKAPNRIVWPSQPVYHQMKLEMRFEFSESVRRCYTEKLAFWICHQAITRKCWLVFLCSRTVCLAQWPLLVQLIISLKCFHVVLDLVKCDLWTCTLPWLASVLGSSRGHVWLCAYVMSPFVKFVLALCIHVSNTQVSATRKIGPEEVNETDYTRASVQPISLPGQVSNKVIGGKLA